MIQLPRVSRTGNGFTLVEVLVALTIFSVVALASFRLLSSTALFVRANEGKQTLRLEQERAMAIVVNDLIHAVVQPLNSTGSDVVDASGDLPKPAMSGRSNGFYLMFSRSDYFQMDEELAPKNVQVHYELRPSEGSSEKRGVSQPGDELVRTVSYPMNNDGEQSASRSQVLLPQVRDISVRFLTSNDQWMESWPQQREPDKKDSNPSKLFSDFNHSLPKAIELVLELGDHRVRKLIGLRS